MANKYFNKQVAESRKPLASGSMVKAISEFNKPHNLPPKDYKKSTSKELKALEGFRKVSPKPLDNIRSNGDKMKIQFNKQKNRTIHERNKASAKTFDTSKGTGKDIQKRNEATKKMFKDAKGEK